MKSSVKSRSRTIVRSVTILLACTGFIWVFRQSSRPSWMSNPANTPIAEAQPLPVTEPSPPSLQGSRASSIERVADPTVRENYRILIDHGEFSVVKRTLLRGQFRDRRAGSPHPGMLNLQLVDGHGSILSSATIHDPSRSCQACDPQVGNLPVVLRDTASNLFEVGFPECPEASSLRISRISTVLHGRIEEQPIAELTLPRRP